jgi:hypothetical protein
MILNFVWLLSAESRTLNMEVQLIGDSLARLELWAAAAA